MLYPAELRVRFERANLLIRPRKGKSKRGWRPGQGAAAPLRPGKDAKCRTFRENLPQIFWGSVILVPCPAPLRSLRLNRQDFAPAKA